MFYVNCGVCIYNCVSYGVTEKIAENKLAGKTDDEMYSSDLVPQKFGFLHAILCSDC